MIATGSPHHPTEICSDRRDALFGVVIHERLGGRVLAFRGELDLAGAQTALEAVAFADRDDRKVLIDLERLTFIDASGLRVLLAAQQLLGGRLTLTRGRGAVARVLELTGLDARLPFAAASRASFLAEGTRRRAKPTGSPRA